MLLSESIKIQMAYMYVYVYFSVISVCKQISQVSFDFDAVMYKDGGAYSLDPSVYEANS